MIRVLSALFLSLLLLPLFNPANAATTYGRFQNFIDGRDIDAPLLKPNGTQILPSEVPTLYGTPEGMTIYDNGIDICSWAYVAQRGLARKKRPVYQDLSDAAGWPSIAVEPDTVAIDPTLGRFKVSEGSSAPSKLVTIPGNGEVGVAWENGLSPGAYQVRVLRKTTGFSSNANDGVVVYEGSGVNVIDHQVTNGQAYYYSVFHLDPSGAGTTSPLSSTVIPDATRPPLNLIQNPGFEDTSAAASGVATGWHPWPWSTSAADATFNLNSSTVHSGAISQEIISGATGSTGTTNGYFAQTVTLQDNTQYTMSFWGMTEGSSRILLTVIGTNWSKVVDTSFSSIGTFRQKSVTFTTPNNGGQPIAFNVNFKHSGTPLTSVFIDDIVLFKAPVSTPAVITSVSNFKTGFAVPGTGRIEVQGNYAYLASGEGDFQVVDISNKQKPTVITKYPVDFNAQVTISGNTLFLTGMKALRTLDVSDPFNPQYPGGAFQHFNIAGSLPWQPSGGGVPIDLRVINGLGYSVVAGGTYGLYVLDISNPSKLVEIGKAAFADPKGANSLYIDAQTNRAYVGLVSGGGAIVDISTPSAPTPLGSYVLGPRQDPIYDQLRLIGVSGSTMIMASNWRPINYFPSRAAKIVLIDASNPALPVQRGVYSFGTDAQPANRAVYLSASVSNGGLIYVVDQNTLSFGRLDRSMNNTHLMTFDISNLDAPVLVDDFVPTQPSRFRSISKYGQYLYINDYNYGLRIFDASTPTKPVEVGGAVTAGEAHYTWVNDDASIAYVAQTFGGSIYVIDIQNPASPKLLGTYWDGEWNEHSPLTGRGAYLYIPQRMDITIVDAHDPTNLAKIGVFPGLSGDLSEQWPRISTFGHYAYVSTFKRTATWGVNEKWLYVYDIQNPSTPVLMGSTAIATSPFESSAHIYATGNYVYAMLPNDTKFLSIDVSNPSLPTVVGSLSDPTNFLFGPEKGEFVGRLCVTNGMAYITSGRLGVDGLLYLVDVSNPKMPALAGTTTVNAASPSYPVEDLRCSGRFLYAGAYGLYYVFDISNTYNPTLLTTAPSISAWSSGPLFGQYLFSNNLDGLTISKMIRDNEYLAGQVSVQALTVAPDITPPSLTVPADIVIEASSTLTPVSLGIANAVDLVDGAVAVSNNAPTAFPVGTTIVTWSATDAAGNTATATQSVTVTDTTTPALTIPANVTLEATAFLTPVTVGSATATDLVDGAVAVSNNAPTAFPVGTTVVTWSAIDAAGNTATATQTVTVTDTTPPALTVPAAITLEATAFLTPVTVGSATATDLVDGAIAVSNNAPAAFPVGTTIVTWSATDAAGNTATATQTVTVTDTTPPSISADLSTLRQRDDQYVKVEYAAVDIADPSPTIQATLNGKPVGSGALIEMDDAERFVLVVIATDASGNTQKITKTLEISDHRHDLRKGKRHTLESRRSGRD